MIEELDKVPPITADEVYRAVNSAESYLPLAKAFEEVNQCYSEYLDVSRRFLTSADPPSRKEVEVYIDLSESYWVLFCTKLRLKTVRADIDEHRFSHWQEVYRDTLAEFRTELSDFEEVIVKTGTNSHNPSRVSENSSWGRVANELLNDSD
jgi:hypothetical protein